MIIDLHTHEYLYSACSRMSVEEAVAAAQRYGLDGICITDHNSANIQFAECLQTINFPVFVGVEQYTRQGDMIAFGLDLGCLPMGRPTAQEFVDFIVARDGFCFAAHPFRTIGGGLGAHLYAVINYSGIEIYNGSNTDAENHEALIACRALGKIPVAGSDAHFADEVGSFATYFPEPIATIQELVAALKAGKGRPVIRKDDGYHFLPVA